MHLEGRELWTLSDGAISQHWDDRAALMPVSPAAAQLRVKGGVGIPAGQGRAPGQLLFIELSVSSVVGRRELVSVSGP